MEEENISTSTEAKRALGGGCPRCEQNTHFITHVVVQRMLTHIEGELHFYVDEKCRTPNDGSVVYIECGKCGFIVYIS